MGVITSIGLFIAALAAFAWGFSILFLATITIWITIQATEMSTRRRNFKIKLHDKDRTNQTLYTAIVGFWYITYTAAVTNQLFGNLFDYILLLVLPWVTIIPICLIPKHSNNKGNNNYTDLFNDRTFIAILLCGLTAAGSVSFIVNYDPIISAEYFITKKEFLEKYIDSITPPLSAAALLATLYGLMYNSREQQKQFTREIDIRHFERIQNYCKDSKALCDWNSELLYREVTEGPHHLISTLIKVCDLSLKSSEHKTDFIEKNSFKNPYQDTSYTSLFEHLKIIENLCAEIEQIGYIIQRIAPKQNIRLNSLPINDAINIIEDILQDLSYLPILPKMQDEDTRIILRNPDFSELLRYSKRYKNIIELKSIVSMGINNESKASKITIPQPVYRTYIQHIPDYSIDPTGIRIKDPRFCSLAKILTVDESQNIMRQFRAIRKRAESHLKKL